MSNAKKILIVEDELIVAEDMADTLRSFGYQVVAIVSTGEKALAKISHTLPDLVLMDIMLKGDLDGVETAEKIRETWDVPIIFLTANADENTVERATSTEPFGYLVKPVQERDLKRNIEIALRRHSSERKIKDQMESADNLRKQAEEERDSKSRYISMASHEFRTPLTTILMSSELLKQYGSKLSEEKKQKHFARIETAVKTMNQLLEDVLTLGKAESGKICFKPAPLNLVEFCHDLVDMLQQNSGSKHKLIFKYEGDLTDAVMDEKLLHHILSNLISNAIKYSPLGGNVLLEASRQEDKVVFRVQDWGIGIPMPDLAKLFDAFHRAKNVGTIPGTGLGLAIVKRAVDLHDGTISVRSETSGIHSPGITTIFTVTIPLQSQIS